MKTKRILAIVLILATLMLNCSSIAFAANATQPLKSMDILGGGVVYRYDSSTKTVVISKEMSGNGCTFNYAESPFYGSDIETVVINDGVIELTRALFYGAKKLKSISLSNSVTFIGTSTFEGCTSLTDITIPNSVTAIDYNAFKGCRSLRNITIPTSVEKIGNYAFFQCSNLTNLTITAGTKLTTIPHGAFQECTYLKQVSLAEGIKALEGRVFEDCRYLANISLPDSITDIGAGAFRNCINLKTVKLPKDLERITESMFSGCAVLNNINIPNSLRTIGASAFSGCKQLTDITIPACTEDIGNAAFRECGNIYVDENNENYMSENAVLYLKDGTRLLHCSTAYSGNYTAPETIKVIDSYAFSECTSLTGADLSESKITSISDRLFNNCKALENVVIPTGVTKINSSVFYNTQNLEAVVIPETVNTIAYNVFYGNNVIGKFVKDDISDVQFSSNNNQDNIIVGWKAVTLGEATELNEETATFLLNIDETNPISELKYEIGEKDRDFFQSGGQPAENNVIIIPQGTETVTLYSRDTGGNETVNVCTVPAYNLPKADDITFGQELGDSSLNISDIGDILGTWTWQNPDIIPNAGTNAYTVVFTPDDTQNYNSITAEIFVTVNKAEPEYVIPADLTAVYTPTLTLADIALPDGWRWLDENTVLTASENTYEAIFTPSDTENYKSITADITVTIDKAAPEYVIPADLTAVYSPKLTLADIELPDGFSWNEPDTKLCVPGGEYKAVYTPADSENYNTAKLTLTVTITKYTPVIGVDIQLPTASDITYGQKLADSVLTPSESDKVEGEWTWEDSEVMPSEGEMVIFNAVFTSDDSNYETVSVEIPVTVNETDDNKPHATIKPSEGGGSSGGGHSRRKPAISSSDEKADEKPTPTPENNSDGAVNKNTEYDLPYIAGYDDKTFRPNANITRAEVTSALVKAAKLEMTEQQKPVFIDVSSHWAKSYIDTVSMLNIIDGYDDKTFRPDNSITRAEFAKIIAVFVQEDIPNMSAKFADTQTHWAEKYIAALSEKDIIRGYDNNTFRPDALITRAEAITIINRVVSRNCAPDIKVDFEDIEKSHWAYNEILQAAGKQSV